MELKLGTVVHCKGWSLDIYVSPLNIGFNRLTGSLTGCIHVSGLSHFLLQINIFGVGPAVH